MSKETVFWKQANGKLVSVDSMDTNHIKNAFKYLIKKHEQLVKDANVVVEQYNALVRKRKAERGSASFTLNGDIAQSFINDMEDIDYHEFESDLGYHFNNDEFCGNQE